MQNRKRFATLAALLLGAAVSTAFAQEIASNDASLPDAPSTVMEQQSTPAGGQAAHPNAQGIDGKQTKRILGIIPNFRSVSADVKLPPQTVKVKFLTSTEDSFDYTSFLFAGALAGVSYEEGSYPEFGQGGVAYGRYYWHTFLDQADENYQVEFVLPALLHQDSRYYTLGHGGVLKRAAYSFSRVLITRTDAGNETFNASEIVGAGAASGISDLYYPTPERTWTKTGQRWLLNVSLDGVTFIFKEFWPDINGAIFHQKTE
jgi:hypothetical protein